MYLDNDDKKNIVGFPENYYSEDDFNSNILKEEDIIKLDKPLQDLVRESDLFTKE